MKEHCLKALWLCRCIQACLMLGGVVPQVGGVGVLGGVEISLSSIMISDKVIGEGNFVRDQW